MRPPQLRLHRHRIYEAPAIGMAAVCTLATNVAASMLPFGPYVYTSSARRDTCDTTRLMCSAPLYASCLRSWCHSRFDHDTTEGSSQRACRKTLLALLTPSTSCRTQS